MNKHQYKRIALLVLLATAMATSSCAVALPSTSNFSQEASVEFSLPSDDGRLVTVPLRGSRITLLDFFAPTCEPCKHTLPALLRRRAELEAAGARVVLVGILADSETTEDARRALAEWGVSLPFLVDREGLSSKELGVRRLPATIIVDEQGIVRWVASANASVDDIVAVVRADSH